MKSYFFTNVFYYYNINNFQIPKTNTVFYFEEASKPSLNFRKPSASLGL